MTVVIRNGKVISVSGGSIVTTGDVVGGRIVGGNKITVDGVTIITGEPAPEIHEEYYGILNVTIETAESVTLSTGKEFKIDGNGYCQRSGDTAIVSGFAGSIQLPDIDGLDVSVNSGHVSGSIATTNLSAKVNSGSVRLSMRSRVKSPTINAKTNSGEITINVL